MERAREAARKAAKEMKLAERRKSAAAKAAAKMQTSRGTVRKRAFKKRGKLAGNVEGPALADMPAEEVCAANAERDYLEDVTSVCHNLRTIDESQTGQITRQQGRQLLLVAHIKGGISIMIKSKMKAVKSYATMVTAIREDAYKNAPHPMAPSQEGSTQTSRCRLQTRKR